MVDVNKLGRSCGLWPPPDEASAEANEVLFSAVKEELSAGVKYRDKDLVETRYQYLRLAEALSTALEVSAEDADVQRAAHLGEVMAAFGPEMLGSAEEVEEVFCTLPIALKPDRAARLRTRMREKLCSGFDEVCALWKTYSSEAIHPTGEALAQDVSDLKELIDTQEEEELRLEAEEFQRHWYLSQILTDLANNMIALVEEHVVMVRPDADRAEAAWLLETARAMTAKLRALKAESTAETYTPSSVSALRRVRREVDRALQDANEELDAAEARTREYDAVTALGFRKLTEEYAEVSDRVQHLTWTLEQLCKTSTQQ